VRSTGARGVRVRYEDDWGRVSCKVKEMTAKISIEKGATFWQQQQQKTHESLEPLVTYPPTEAPRGETRQPWDILLFM